MAHFTSSTTSLVENVKNLDLGPANEAKEEGNNYFRSKEYDNVFLRILVPLIYVLQRTPTQCQSFMETVQLHI